jgi:hypothetical protein
MSGVDVGSGGLAVRAVVLVAGGSGDGTGDRLRAGLKGAIGVDGSAVLVDEKTSTFAGGADETAIAVESSG